MGEVAFQTNSAVGGTSLADADGVAGRVDDVAVDGDALGTALGEVAGLADGLADAKAPTANANIVQIVNWWATWILGSDR